ncbi:MAG TPA: hypothetical protein VM142_04225 [Acidimicrobiales bacterium]|nr:hypothetical protein [Acidimicrobiales bacterium]
MAQPEYVPLSAADRVRPSERLPQHGGWRQDRPGEITRFGPPTGKLFGKPGPDQGYALKLAESFHGKLQLATGEHDHDAMTGCLGVALRRASMFGRAPVVHDLTLAFTLWGFLGDAPPELAEFRTSLFQGVSHDYNRQREIVDRVNASTLRLTPAKVGEQVQSDWRSLFVW